MWSWEGTQVHWVSALRWVTPQILKKRVSEGQCLISILILKALAQDYQDGLVRRSFSFSLLLSEAVIAAWFGISKRCDVTLPRILWTSQFKMNHGPE